MAAGHMYGGRAAITPTNRLGIFFPILLLGALVAAILWWATHQGPSSLDIPLAELTIRKLLNLLAVLIVGLVLGVLWTRSALLGSDGAGRNRSAWGQFGMVGVVPLVLVVWWFATL